ncbi:MAG TPA: alpha/beta hydrolase-fold protein [Blastocatellia bacterium]|nr:alpha/beta hydrolase-fold protein [Blastocatellia bacterium]
MFRHSRSLRYIFCAFLLFSSIAAIQNQEHDSPLRFRITLSKEIAATAASGRLFVLMTSAPREMESIDLDLIPGSTWIAAMEVEHFAPGATVELNPDLKAFPKPFSQARPGSYQVMALLDPNHTYAYHSRDEGDLTSAVVRVENLNPAQAKPVELTLSRSTPARFKPADSENVKLVEFQSPMLTKFWGRAITMRAGVVLPPSYGKDPNKTYAGVYHVHGFGGDHTGAWRQGSRLVQEMSEAKSPGMIHIFLDGSFPTGHHEFADSVNNGPWGKALTEEFIPHLEKRFRLVNKPYARFLTGHSSGGWSTLWLQVTYPDFFGGTWSTAPDPVDLRSFTGIDATPGSTDNAYRERNGGPKQLVRMGGKFIVALEEFARQEVVMGEYGGQFASFEWVWSPRSEDGRPMKMFNRESGELNQEVLKYWRNYDIRLILEKNWPRLAPKLKGKINVICGDADTFRLEEAVKTLCDFFKEKGSDAVCELVPGRDHMNLYDSYQTYPDGLAARIYKEMAAKFEASAKFRTTKK